MLTAPCQSPSPRSAIPATRYPPPDLAAACAAPFTHRAPRFWVDATVALTLCGAWLLLFELSGIAGRKLYLTDDSLIVRMYAELAAGRDFGTVLWSWLGVDLAQRIRPLCLPWHVLRTAWFGLDAQRWFWSQALPVFPTVIMLFVLARRLGWSRHSAVLLPCLGLLGPQAAIWWCFGYQEALGTALLALTLVLLDNAAARPGRWRVGAFIAAALLTTLTKESFAVLTPALVWAYAWRVRVHHGSWRRALRTALLPAVLLCVALGIEGGWALRAALSNGLNARYFGSGFFSLDGLMRMRAEIVEMLIRSEAGLLFVLVGILLICDIDRQRRISTVLVRMLRAAWPGLLALALWLGAELVLHQQCGFAERYRLPAVLAISLACLWAYEHLRVRLPHFAKPALAAVLLYVAYAGQSTFRAASRFAADTVSTERFLQTAARCSAPAGPILVVADPGNQYEWSISTFFSLTLRMGHPAEQIYLHAQRPPVYHTFERQLADSGAVSRAYGERTLADVEIESLRCIALLPGQEAAFLAGRGSFCQGDDFTRVSFPHPESRSGREEFVVYYRTPRLAALPAQARP